MIPNLRIQRWLHGFDSHRLAHLGAALRRKHMDAELQVCSWELADTEPGVRR